MPFSKNSQCNLKCLHAPVLAAGKGTVGWDVCCDYPVLKRQLTPNRKQTATRWQYTATTEYSEVNTGDTFPNLPSRFSEFESNRRLHINQKDLTNAATQLLSCASTTRVTPILLYHSSRIVNNYNQTFGPRSNITTCTAVSAPCYQPRRLRLWEALGFVRVVHNCLEGASSL